MTRNYITEQCCSAEDLQSYLRSWNPTDPDTIKQAITDIEQAIDYEGDHQRRVSIRTLLRSKQNAIRKLQEKAVKRDKIYLKTQNKMNNLKKHDEYAQKLMMQIMAVITDEDCDNYIGIEEISENAAEFTHAMMNIAPALVYTKLTGEDKNLLECNHVANQLCFQYSESKY